jgi:hypothetical protein
MAGCSSFAVIGAVVPMVSVIVPLVALEVRVAEPPGVQVVPSPPKVLLFCPQLSETVPV